MDNIARMNTFIERNKKNIADLCEAHKVKSLYAFGSVLTPDFNDRSDIDFVVDFLPQDVLEYAENYYELKFALKEILRRDIDLLEEKAIKNPYFKQAVNEKKRLVYGYRN